MMTNPFWCLMLFLCLVSLPSLFFTSLTTRVYFSLLFCFVKVLAGMNVHPTEFDSLKQEYNVKGYPTFCYFEWVESSHLSHFRLSPHFQGSEHLSRDTSNRKHSPGLVNANRHDAGRLAPCKGDPRGPAFASTMCKGESFWQALDSSGIPFEARRTQVLLRLFAVWSTAWNISWQIRELSSPLFW